MRIEQRVQERPYKAVDVSLKTNPKGRHCEARSNLLYHMHAAFTQVDCFVVPPRNDERQVI